MAKKRLIYTFLFDGRYCVLSRNFRLQKIGSIDWIKESFKTESIPFSIDELVLLNVSRNLDDKKEFYDLVSQFSAELLAPLAVGGMISSIDDVHMALRSGADKIIVNSSINSNPEFVTGLVNRFGSQFVVGSIDYRSQNGQHVVYVDGGNIQVGVPLFEYIDLAIELNIGELYLTSIDRDGTGMGLDVDVVTKVVDRSSVPITASGGAGNYHHIADCFRETNCSAVSTANLFNFLGNGLLETRKYLVSQKIDLADWKIDCINLPR